MHLAYLEQDCDLTLREGLKQHYAVDPSFKKNADLAPAFYNHDLAHVLFGLSTSPKHETLADTRVVFGTNWGAKKYMKDYFQDPKARQIVLSTIKDIGYLQLFLLSILSFGKVIRVIWDCRKMSKKWIINPSEELLDTKLCDLRKEYNITVIN